MRETAIVGLGWGVGRELKQRDGFGLKESRTRAHDGTTGCERRGEGRGKEREGGVMEEEWVSGRAVRREVGRRGGREGGRGALSLQRWAFLSPAPVRSKVYRGFNFTFPQPIRARLLLLGEL